MFSTYILMMVLVKEVVGLADLINTFSVGLSVPTSLTGAPSAIQSHYLLTNTEFSNEGFVVGFQVYCNVGGTASLSVRPFNSTFSLGCSHQKANWRSSFGSSMRAMRALSRALLWLKTSQTIKRFSPART